MSKNLLKPSIYSELEIINNSLLEEIYEDKDQIGLYSGLTGIGLLMALNYMATKNEIYFDKLSEILDRTIDYIQLSEELKHNYSIGLAGWGWLIEFLIHNEIIEANDDFNVNEIDAYILKCLQEQFVTGEQDILNGEIGVANYFLKKGNLEAVTTILDFLVETKIDNLNETYWLRRNITDVGPIVDFGLAHGNAGILNFLIRCYNKGFSKELCVQLITRNVTFFTNNVQPFGIANSYFPNAILEGKYKSGNNSLATSRLSWCSGDLTIWYNILKAADIIDDINLRETAIHALVLNASRRDKTYITTADFCHGSAGVAYIFMKLWNLTCLTDFKIASEFWLGKTLNFQSDETFDHSKEIINKKSFKKSSRLLEGDAGIAIVYLNYLYPELADWDDCLL